MSEANGLLLRADEIRAKDGAESDDLAAGKPWDPKGG